MRARVVPLMLAALLLARPVAMPAQRVSYARTAPAAARSGPTSFDCIAGHSLAVLSGMVIGGGVVMMGEALRRPDGGESDAEIRAGNYVVLAGALIGGVVAWFYFARELKSACRAEDPLDFTSSEARGPVVMPAPALDTHPPLPFPGKVRAEFPPKLRVRLSPVDSVVVRQVAPVALHDAMTSP